MRWKIGIGGKVDSGARSPILGSQVMYIPYAGRSWEVYSPETGSVLRGGTLPSTLAAQIPGPWQPGDQRLLSGATEGPLIERLGDTDMEGSSTNQSGARPTDFREAYQYKTPPTLRASNWLFRLVGITGHLEKQQQQQPSKS